LGGAERATVNADGSGFTAFVFFAIAFLSSIPVWIQARLVPPSTPDAIVH
jgi:hypothetical protein